VRFAVVGHNEWIEFARVDHVPVAGEIVHATDGWEEPGGGGAVAAVQLARLAGSSTFFTAVGDDERGIWTGRDLTPRGVQVRAAVRGEPTRRAVVFVDANGERTIATLGRRLEPEVADHLPWEELEDTDAIYFTAGDEGALRQARRARVLVATSRAMKRLAEADVELDAIVGSARDPAERYDPSGLSTPPRLVVMTEGREGGRFETADGRSGTYETPPPPAPVVDTYGAGDSFAAGLTYALGTGLDVEKALGLAARCGAWVVAGRGPYERQLTAADLDD
jgi:ribokinase